MLINALRGCLAEFGIVTGLGAGDPTPFSERPELEFPDEGHDDGLGPSLGFISVNGSLLPMAPSG